MVEQPSSDEGGDFELDTEGWVDEGGYEENWNSMDKERFVAAWVASMEALEATPLEHLSDDGFISDQWNLNQKLIQSTILSLGFTDTKLLAQKGDELSMTTQVIAHLGLEVAQAETEFHRRCLAKQILDICLREPLAKRIRGEHLSPALQRMQDTIQAALRGSSEAPAVTGISDAGEGWMIPGPGRRSWRSRLRRARMLLQGHRRKGNCRLTGRAR